MAYDSVRLKSEKTSRVKTKLLQSYHATRCHF